MGVSQTGLGKRTPVAKDAKARKAGLRELEAVRAALSKAIDEAKTCRAELDAEQRALQGSASPQSA